MFLYNNALNYWMKLLKARFALGTRSCSKCSEMNLWEKATSCVSELAPCYWEGPSRAQTGRVQGCWRKNLGPERQGRPAQGGPQLFLHSARRWPFSSKVNLIPPVNQ